MERALALKRPPAVAFVGGVKCAGALTWSLLLVQWMETTAELKNSRPRMAWIGRPMVRSIGLRSTTATLMFVELHAADFDGHAGQELRLDRSAGAKRIDLVALRQADRPRELAVERRRAGAGIEDDLGGVAGDLEPARRSGCRGRT